MTEFPSTNETSAVDEVIPAICTFPGARQFGQEAVPTRVVDPTASPEYNGPRLDPSFALN